MRGGEVPRQQFMDAIDWVIGDLFQDAAKIEFWVEAVKLGRAEQRIDRSSTLPTGIRSAEQEVLPPQSYGT